MLVQRKPMNTVLHNATDRTRRKVETVPTLHERKQQVVRDAIWDAATDLFAEKGFNETTVDDIAEMSGVSRRSFFRYFESKNDLMAYAMVSYGAELIAAIDRCPKSYSLHEVLRETVHQVAVNAAPRPRTKKILGIVSKYPDARAAQSARMTEVQEHVTEALARRCRKAGEDNLTARILAGLIVELAGLTIQWWYENGQPDMADAVDHTFSTVSRLMCESTKSNDQRPVGREQPGHK
jgi:AcrR family transcriptional regulator